VALVEAKELLRLATSPGRPWQGKWQQGTQAEFPAPGCMAMATCRSANGLHPQHGLEAARKFQISRSTRKRFDLVAHPSTDERTLP